MIILNFSDSQATDDDIHGSSETPASDGDISSEQELEEKTDNVNSTNSFGYGFCA